MRKLYKFHWDAWYSVVEGLFVANDEHVKATIGKEIYFEDVAGKHSEVEGELMEEDLEVISEDPTVIDALLKATDGVTSICGLNPLDYVWEEED